MLREPCRRLELALLASRSEKEGLRAQQKGMEMTTEAVHVGRGGVVMRSNGRPNDTKRGGFGVVLTQVQEEKKDDVSRER